MNLKNTVDKEKINDNKGAEDMKDYIGCDDNYDDDDEGLSVYEAAEIWASNGMDEDYMFGYTEEELEEAL